MSTDADIELAHVSDTHVALEQYPVTSPTSGRNQRGQDILRAFANVTADIDMWDPPLVIHSGDVAEKPVISYRHQLQIQTAFRTLSKRRDGSPRLVIVISGNHDMPRDPREPCYLEPALRPLPSVITVTNKYQQVHLAPYVDRGEADESLREVVVHCLPHDTLKDAVWDDITPVPGKTNILTSHGVVGGSELFKRSHGREYSIPIDVLVRGWDYVALGHFHKPGPVAVGGLKDDTTPIWYAGSTENCGFSDLRDGVGGRGYLRVKVRRGQVPAVTKVDLPIRAMFRLPVLDADGMTFEQVSDTLVERIKAAEVAGAVVDQKVLNVHRDTWSLVDVASARRAAGDALWYQATPIFTRASDKDGEEGTTPAERLGDMGQILRETAEALLPDETERDAVMTLSRRLLGSALHDIVPENAETDEAQQPTPAAASHSPAPAETAEPGTDTTATTGSGAETDGKTRAA